MIEKFNSLPGPWRYGIFGGVILFILVLDFFTLISLQKALLKNTVTRTEQLKQDIARVKTDKQRLDQIKQNLDQLNKGYEDLSQRVRPLSELSSILEDVSRIAQEAGVKLDQLTPLRDRQETIFKGDAGTFYSLPISLDTHSGYHAFGRFLNKLENEKLYFSIKEVTMENDLQAGGNLLVHAVLKTIVTDKE